MVLAPLVTMSLLAPVPASSGAAVRSSDLAPYETVLGKFGARLAINPKPQFGRVAFSPMGRFHDRVLEMVLGIRYGGRTRVLPFSRRHESFETIEQRITPTSVSYRCSSSRFPFGVRITWVAPFYPRDRKLCTAPFLYLDVEIDNPSRHTLDAEVLVSLPIDEQDRPVRWDGFAGVRVERSESGRRAFQGIAFLGPPSIEPRIDGATLVVPVRAGRFATAARRFALVGFVADPVFDVRGRLHRFAYTRHFSGPDDVAAYARDERARILERAAVFDSTILDTGLSEPLLDLISFAFQSFACGVWWCADDEGRDWLSTWDGPGRLHSPLDVEADAALFYLHYWPEILGLLLDEWAHVAREDGRLPRHLGIGPAPDGGLSLGAAPAEPEAEVEGIASSLLLLDAYWRATADSERATRLLPLARALGRRLLESDADGDGFPDRFTATAFDDAGEAVRLGGAQTFLAVQVLAALRALSDLLSLEPVREAPEASRLARRVLAAELRLTRTLREEAWIGDHFAVCLERERRGFDGFTIHTASGLLHPLRTNLEVPVDRERARLDLLASLGRTLRTFGCAHSDGDASGWISRNLRRDAVAGYLGVDLESNAERYWRMQLERNRAGAHAEWGGFCDSPTDRGRSYSPRGIAAVALVPALAGLQIDRVGGVLRYAPVRSNLSVPLTPFADWEKGEIPWLRIRSTEGNGRLVSITHRSRLGAMRVVDASAERDDGVSVHLVSGIASARGHRGMESVEARKDGGHCMRVASWVPGPFHLSIAPLSADRYDVFVDGRRWSDFTREDLARGVLVPGAPRSPIAPSVLAAGDALAERLDAVASVGDSARAALDRVRAAIDSMWEADARDRAGRYEIVPRGGAASEPRPAVLRDAADDLERAILEVLASCRTLPPADRERLERAIAPVDVRLDVSPRAGGHVLARLRLRNDLLRRAAVSAILSADAGLLPLGVPVESFVLERGERREWTLAFVPSGPRFPLEPRIRASVSLEGAGGESIHWIEASAASEDGFVRQWLVCGPFARPESPVADAAHPPGCDGSSAFAWREAAAPEGWLDLRPAAGAGAAVAYAHAYLFSPEDATLAISMGTSGGVKLFVDGREAHRGGAARPGGAEEESVAVAVTAGWHRLLLELESAGGRFGAWLRVRGAAGLEVAIAPPDVVNRNEVR